MIAKRWLAAIATALMIGAGGSAIAAPATGSQGTYTSPGGTVIPAQVHQVLGLENGNGALCLVGSDATCEVPSGGGAIIGPLPLPASVTPGVAGSTSSSVILKASAGSLNGAYVTTGATAGFLMVFNAVSAPSNGSTTAGTASGNLEECVTAPANSTTSINANGSPPEAFSVGITAMFSSTGCGTLTASTTAYLHGSAQ